MRKHPKEPLEILKIPPGISEESFIAERCKLYTQKMIAAEFNLDLECINIIYKKYNISQYLSSIKSKNTRINPFQEQIIISGIIGDGRIKPNGNSFYYEECHKITDERQYCEWKYFSLGDLTKGVRMSGKNFNNKDVNGINFQTVTTSSLAPYYYMKYDLSQAISKLTTVGLMLLILDDGWFTQHSHSGNFCLAGGMMTEYDMKLLCERYRSIGIECNIVYHNKKKGTKDISFSSKSNMAILNFTSMFLPLSMDICQKKFGYILSTLNTYNPQPNGNSMLRYNK